MAKDIWKRPGTKTWYTNVWDPVRKIKIKKAVGPSAIDARSKAAEIRAQLGVSSPFKTRPKFETPRLEDFMPRFIDVQYKGKPSYNYARQCLSQFHDLVSNCRLSEINKGVLQRYVTKRLSDPIHSPYRGRWSKIEKAKNWTPKEIRTVSKSTVNREITVIQCMLNRATEWGELASNPLVGFRKFSEKDKIRKRYLQREEIQALLKAAKSSLNKQLVDILMLALYIGRRKGEILRLRKQDYDNENGYLYLGRTKAGGTEKIPVPDTAQAVLRRLCKEVHGEWLFPNRAGTGPVKNINTAFHIACRKAGITDIVFHHLRHTMISHAVMSGVNFLAIARLVGHANASMVEQRYGHLSEEYKIASSKIFGKHMDKLMRKSVEAVSQEGPAA